MAVTSQLEMFVKSFIRTHRRKSITTKAIDDSISILDLKLSKHQGFQVVIPVRSKNILTNAVLAYANITSKFIYKDSIIRTRDLLDAFKNS